MCVIKIILSVLSGSEFIQKGKQPMCVQEEYPGAITVPEDCPVSDEVKPHLSKSQMDRYLTCPRSHYFNYEMKINSRSLTQTLYPASTSSLMKRKSGKLWTWACGSCRASASMRTSIQDSGTGRSDKKHQIALNLQGYLHT